MHNNVKLNYRDSGDGKVSTRVDTRQVQSCKKEAMMWHALNSNAWITSLVIWKYDKEVQQDQDLKRKEQDQRYMWYMWSDDPTFILVFAKNTRWTVPLWSLGFSAPETYITCAIWRKGAQTETSWIWIIFEMLWRGLKRRFEMTQVDGNNFHWHVTTWPRKLGKIKFQRKRHKRSAWWY